MEDLLFRTLKQGDLCVEMPFGKNSRNLCYGIIDNNKFTWVDSTSILRRTNAEKVYLIENPTNEEITKKEAIKYFIDLENEEKRKIESAKSISVEELKVGGIYRSRENVHYLYLGKGEVDIKTKSFFKNSNRKGYIFVLVDINKIKSCQTSDEKLLKIMDYYTSPPFIFVDNKIKDVIEQVDYIEIELPIIYQNSFDGKIMDKIKITKI